MPAPVFASGKTKAVLALAILLLTLLTVFRQIDHLGPDYYHPGLAYVENNQLVRHNNVLQGRAPAPWQYRPLSEWMAEALLRAVRALGLPHPVLVAFIGLRLVQNALIFLLAALLYVRLTRSWLAALLGLAVLGWSMTQALYDSDLAFNTYLDVVFYLTAALLIWDRRPLWIVPLMVLAAFNRETSGLLPLLLLLSAPLLASDRAGRLSIYRMAVAAFLIYAVIVLGLRLHWPGPRPFAAYGLSPGWGILTYNTLRVRPWAELLCTFSLIPLLAALAWRQWPPLVRVFFWAILPIWLLVLGLAGFLEEARYMLIPQALIFIPGMLSGLVPSPGDTGLQTCVPAAVDNAPPPA
jgi:hypothetical protein